MGAIMGELKIYYWNIKNINDKLIDILSQSLKIAIMMNFNHY